MNNANKKRDLMARLNSLARRRGIVFPTAELYGGLGAVWDFGPVGAQMKKNLRDLWWQRFVESRPDIIGLESAIITPRKVLQASGHEKGFSDPLVECKICHERFRADKTIQSAKDHQHELTGAKKFNLMFKTHLGSTEENSEMAYLRPETAQGMFVNFKRILESARVKLPFGFAQIGKSFRNEITTGDFIFRMREFEIAEIEYFVSAREDEEWFIRWVDEWENFIRALGIKPERLRRFEHQKANLAHYSKRTIDIEYDFPFGWGELAGIANRTDFDLKAHENATGQDLKYTDPVTGKKFLPYVIEPTYGIERLLLAVLVDSFDLIKEGEREEQDEIVLRIDPKIAAVKAGIFPLINKDRLPEIARKIQQEFLAAGITSQYDDSGSIGRRYRRQDEIGTPYGITVDFETLKNETVTLRDRDTMKQERVKISELVALISAKVK